MTVTVYMSEISPYWTFERQKAALASVLPADRVFTDALDRKARRGHSAVELVERGQMLRPTRRLRGEVVHVASYAVLAWSADDLLAVLAALKRRGARLVSAEDGEAEDVLAAWHAARTKSRHAGAVLRGGEVTKARKAAEYAPKVEAIRDRWGNPAYDTATLLAEAGVSRNTATKYLGILRGEAIRKEAARLKRKAKKEAGSK
jgi:hypothetical protein